MIWFLETLGEAPAIAILGLLVGVLFGASAQQSRFCLRAATAEVADGRFGPRLAIWLLVFTAAFSLVQGFQATGLLALEDARQFASMGSLSGAIIGGVLFGIGMILARGCASRLLVLSATGNLRALVTGLVLTLVAQASLTGILAPLRLWFWGLWTVPAGSGRHLGQMLGLPTEVLTVVALITVAGAILWAWRGVEHRPRTIAFSLGVGAAVAAGWLVTYQASLVAFEPVAVSSITFTGPATDTLMGLVASPEFPLSFGAGLVPGVFLGSGLAAILTGEFHIQRFEPDAPMERYLLGGSLMGFGAMLAGGCAVGAGVTGGAALSSTAWVALFAMWAAAMATHRLMQRRAPALA